MRNTDGEERKKRERKSGKGNVKKETGWDRQTDRTSIWINR